LMEETRVTEPRKTTNLSQVTDKLHHITLYVLSPEWDSNSQH
jgi:hypothetical protein